MKIGDRVFVRGYVDEIRKDTVIVRNDGGYFGTVLSEVTGELPSAQQEIIHCKDCRKHNKKLGFDENYNITYKDDACPLIPWRGMSKGHEHDYQSCCFGEKRGVTT